MTTSPLESVSQPDPAVLAADDVGAPPGGWPNPRRGFLFFLGLASIGAGMASLVPAVLTLSLKAQQIDAQNATTVLSVVVGVGSVFSLVAFPALGRLSDRTTGRLGRRRPYLLLGALLFALGAVGIIVATNTVTLTVANVVTAVGYSSTAVAFTAAIPDQLAPNRRGPASALAGLSLPVGAVTGLFIAQLVAPNLAAMVLLPAGVAVVGAVLFALRLSDRKLSAAERPHFGWAQFLGTFWVNPLRHPSYGWAWCSRLLLFLGVAAIQAYQAFYLIMVLHFAPEEVAGAVFLSTLVLTAAALVFAPIAAKASDRIGRRKPFVVAAAVVFAVGLALASFAQSFPAFLVAIGVVGLGQGVYMAVDIALVTQVLPDPGNPAKDLGIMNLASTLPGTIVPTVAPFVLAIGATAASPQNFSALFVLGAVAALVGAACILPIRRVR
ncbi:MFS transporter [Geodermatophilus sp. TF02-6]|uniref:MFS transporter n=1 Tax=Geodermatophilus sp. TF02-6 TaxID=2250575 RepID=UPI000DE8C571|nr:MFS transporter [Geodermatophilus sp. TF02-6]RBY77204.1 MFS transporter [Geodermatophilus sp. TF02-6]